MSEAEPLSERQQSDVRHRFANVFQLVSALSRMRAQRTSDPETRRQLAWLLDATSVIALVQQRQLGPAPDDFAGYLEDLAAQWRRRCADRPIQIDLTAAPIAVREQLVSPLALIANELVGNALAHAFAEDRGGRVQVSLRALDEGRAELVVSDDGRSYDPGAVGQSTLGLWLIRGLTDQVRGVMTTTTEDGVSVRLEFATQ